MIHHPRGRAVPLAFVTAMLIAAPVSAMQPGGDVQLVRAGDHAMTCDALTAEINTLAHPAADPAKPKRKRAGGFLKVLGSVAPFVPGVGMGAMLAGSALSSVGDVAEQDADRQAALDAVARRGLDDAASAIADQRKERLIAIFEAKRC